jgi:hypothetical protein
MLNLSIPKCLDRATQGLNNGSQNAFPSFSPLGRYHFRDSADGTRAFPALGERASTHIAFRCQVC